MEGVIKRSVGAGFVSTVYMNHFNVHDIYFQLGPMLSSWCLCLHVVRVWCCSTEPPKKANEFFQTSNTHSVWWHPNKEDRQKLYIKKRTPRWGRGVNKKVQRGMEDGLIGSWLDFFSTLTVVLRHI